MMVIASFKTFIKENIMYKVTIEGRTTTIKDKWGIAYYVLLEKEGQIYGVPYDETDDEEHTEWIPIAGKVVRLSPPGDPSQEEYANQYFCFQNTLNTYPEITDWLENVRKGAYQFLFYSLKIEEV